MPLTPPDNDRPTGPGRHVPFYLKLAWSGAIIPASLLAMACATSHAQSITYRLDPDHTRIQWEIGHFGTSTHRGRFDAIEGQIRLDRQAGRGEVSISVRTASVSSGVLPLDGMLRGEHFLQSESTPIAYFVSRRLRFTGPQLSSLEGELTLRDVSRPLTLHALNFNCYPHPTLQREVCGGDFEAVLRRSDFGLTYGLPLVSDRVRLLIQVEAIRD